MGEEQVLLITVPEPREAGRHPDDDLLDAAEAAAPQPGVDADAQRGHPRPAIHAFAMAASDPRVSIVIPNRNGATPRDGLTFLDMVRDTLAEQSFRDFEVIVVDNGSTDGSVARLRERWPDATVVDLGENLGFSAAVNRGIAAGRGPYVALLNTDIELSPDWLELLVAELDRDPKLGFVTGKIMRHDDRGVIEQAGHDFFTCGRFEPRGLDERDEGQYDERRPTPGVTPAAALYRRDALQAVDGFDEDYFLYCEDGDACLRMLLAGYSGLYVPDPKAFHVRGGTVGPASDLPRFFLVRNALITLLKDLPASVLLRSIPKIALYHWGQLTAARRDGYARRVLQAYGSFLRMAPGTLRKRRAIQRGRALAPAPFAGRLRTDYPFPTRLERLLG